MRTRLLILIAAVGLVGSANAEAADKSQTAVWTSHELQFHGTAFLSPGVMDSGEPLALRRTSPDQLYGEVEFVLQQLGARKLDLDSRGCFPRRTGPCVDVKFMALSPSDQAGKNALSAPLGAHWQTVTLSGNCKLLAQATKTILPLFAARNVKLIPEDVCEKIHVGLRAEVLMPSAELAAAGGN